MQEAAQVVGMERHAEMATNEFGHAFGRPHLVGPAMRFGTLREQAFELPLLGDVQPGRRSGMRLGGQTVGVGDTCEFEPAKYGARVDAYDASDILWFVAPMNCPNGLASSLLQGAG